MSQLNVKRRIFNTLAVAMMAGAALPTWAQGTQFNDYGWPTSANEKISAKSVAWLKEKGWWPIQVAFQPPWSGQNTINLVMDKRGLLAKRGVDAKFQAFPSGPAINEVIISGRFQFGNGGNFPFTTLFDKNVPVKSIAIINVNLMHAILVPLDSPIKSIDDFKNRKEPATIGIVTGSSAEFYIQAAAKVHGIVVGKDIILKNMPPGEQMAMPKGIDAVVPWDPTPSIMVNERKNARIINDSFPYNIYGSSFYVRQEVIDNAPDVVQAFTDAIVEATLWIRKNPDEAVKAMQEDPNLKNFSPLILRQQIDSYNNLYKPTYLHPLPQFWGRANETTYEWLFENKRIQTKATAATYAAAVDSRFMDRTFAKVGWTIPKLPPFLPATFNAPLDKIPYPTYSTPLNTTKPQAFPERGDLTKDWSFDGKVFKKQ
ncbi:MAG: ABC transporter substrate-binding protein [Polynucleobacter sp.]